MECLPFKYVAVKHVFPRHLCESLTYLSNCVKLKNYNWGEKDIR